MSAMMAAVVYGDGSPFADVITHDDPNLFAELEGQ